jgi:cytoskeletal protein CcmA (bactofilin family)
VNGKAHLARGGRIDGNITSKTLVVEEGGVFHGQSIMDGSAPKEAARSQRASGKASENAQENAPENAQEERDEPEVKVP